MKSDVEYLDSGFDGSAFGENEGSGVRGEEEVDRSASRGIFVDTYGLSYLISFPDPALSETKKMNVHLYCSIPLVQGLQSIEPSHPRAYISLSPV